MQVTIDLGVLWYIGVASKGGVLWSWAAKDISTALDALDLLSDYSRAWPLGTSLGNNMKITSLASMAVQESAAGTG